MRRRVAVPDVYPGNLGPFRTAIVRELEKSQTPDVALDYFHMRAEDGKIYKVTISAAGAFVLTLVQG